ncbi:MAG: ester cyclase [Ktedonobacteraceae bacterium]|nr:ester cyclase [Ktedonobacteraceae bacterium]
MSPSEENKTVVRLLFEDAINSGQLELLDTLFSPDFVDHSTPDQPPGPAGVKTYLQDVRAGFPDLCVAIEDLFAEGERVAVRTSWRGTHRGLYAGKAPTGRQAIRTLIQIFRVSGGKIVEEWNAGHGLLE